MPLLCKIFAINVLYKFKQLSELFVTAGGGGSVGKMCITISEMLQYMYMYLSFTCSKRTWHRSQFKFSGLFHWILYTANIYMYDTHLIRYTCTYDTHMILIWKAIHIRIICDEIAYVCMLDSLRVSMDINEGNGKIYENGIFSQLLHALIPI